MYLYQINEEIEKCFDEETGEIFDESRLQELTLEFDEKVENLALYTKSLEAYAKAIRDEEKALADRRKKAENKAASIKKCLQNVLNRNKFSTPRCAISFRKSEAVNVYNAAEIPAEYWRQREPEVDKAGLKKAIKAGEKIPGAEIVENYNMSIK